MSDLVGTCPKDFFEEWIAEGDPAGTPESGQEWGWYTGHSHINRINVWDRFYVAAHGKLRGYAVVTGFEENSVGERVAIIRKGRAVAGTIDQPIPGFRGLRVRWWKREDEKPFPQWKTP